MPVFLEYLKSRSRGIALFALFAATFGVVFAFYRIPPAAVFYPSTVCAFFALVAGVPDFLLFRQKHRYLRRLIQNTELLGEVPGEEFDLIERDWSTLAAELKSDKRTLQSADQDKYDGMVEYYTVWVHQIKTPISALRLLLQGEETDTKQMSEELQRIEQYVDMVLCYLRLTSGDTDYLIREYDLDVIIRTAVRKYASQFIRRKLKLIYEPAEVRILTDEKWLLFVIEQLLSNALKYTPSGHISISLSPEQVLCIEDTGIGIAPSDLPRIFENGFTGRNGRWDRRSTGIGLYLCKSICSRLGHTLSVESESGSGTRVFIDLSRKRLGIE